MSAKIGGLSEAGGKQLRAAYWPEGILQKFANNTVRRRIPRVADCYVGVADIEVENTVCADYLKRRIGTNFSPAWQPWNKPAARKSVGRCDAERLFAPIALDTCNSRGESFEAIANDWEEAAAGLRGERRRPRPATKK